jgi:hypothetical protein
VILFTESWKKPPQYLADTVVDTLKCGLVFVSPRWDTLDFNEKISWALGRARDRCLPEYRTERDVDLAHDLLCDIVTAEARCVLGYLPTWTDWCDAIAVGGEITLPASELAGWFAKPFVPGEPARAKSLHGIFAKTQVPWNPNQEIEPLSPADALNLEKRAAHEDAVRIAKSKKHTLISEMRRRRFTQLGIEKFLKTQHVNRVWTAVAHNTFVTPDSFEPFDDSDVTVQESNPLKNKSAELSALARGTVLSKTFQAASTASEVFKSQMAPGPLLPVSMDSLRMTGMAGPSVTPDASVEKSTNVEFRLDSALTGAALDMSCFEGPEDMQILPPPDGYGSSSGMFTAPPPGFTQQAMPDSRNLARSTDRDLQMQGYLEEHTQRVMNQLSNLHEDTRRIVAQEGLSAQQLLTYKDSVDPETQEAMADPEAWLDHEEETQDEIMAIHRSSLLAFADERVLRLRKFSRGLVDTVMAKDETIEGLQREVEKLTLESKSHEDSFGRKLKALEDREKSGNSEVLKANSVVTDLERRLALSEKTIVTAKQNLDKFLKAGLVHLDPSKPPVFTLLRERLTTKVGCTKDDDGISFLGKKFINGEAPQLQYFPLPTGNLLVDLSDEACAADKTDRLIKMHQAAEYTSAYWTSIVRVDELPPLEKDRFDTVPTVEDFFDIGKEPVEKVKPVAKPRPSKFMTFKTVD